MFSKLSLSLLLTASISCFGQVANAGGSVTSSGPAVTLSPVSGVNAPLIATPDVALPGSGPAVGVPLGSTNTNDSRSTSGPSFYDPNSPRSVDATAAAATFAAASPANAQPFEVGIQRFESGLPGNGNSVQSLGDIARSYRAKHHQNARAFNNNSISQLNAAGVQTGNLGAGSSTVASAPETESGIASQNPTQENTLMAQNQAPALPQSDQDQATQPARPAAVDQQRHRRADQDAAAPANNTPEAPAANSNTENAKLPQTSSSLPLFALIGFLGLAGGTLYLIRR